MEVRCQASRTRDSLIGPNLTPVRRHLTTPPGAQLPQLLYDPVPSRHPHGRGSTHDRVSIQLSNLNSHRRTSKIF